MFSLMYQRERTLSDLLHGGPGDHASLVAKLGGNVKTLQKSVEALAKAAAIRDAKLLKEQKPKYFICHRFAPRKGLPETTPPTQVSLFQI